MSRQINRLKANATWEERQAAWTARQRRYQRTIRDLREQVMGNEALIDELQAERDKLRYKLSAERKAERAAERAEHEQRHREQVKNWQLYDKAYAETSVQEKALFEASPAYQKYQQWRQTR